MISRTIPNLFNGISQQPASLRNTSQGELMENCYATIASGLGKRPPTEHVAKLSSDDVGSVFIDTLNRDTNERYELILRDGGIQVFDLFTGEEKTVNTPNGVSYLTVPDAAKDFCVVTVADYSFIVNKKKAVAMTTEKSGSAVAGADVTSLSRKAAVPISHGVYDPDSELVTILTTADHTLSVGMEVQLSGTGGRQDRKVKVALVPAPEEGYWMFSYVPHNIDYLNSLAGGELYYVAGPTSSYSTYVAIMNTATAHGLTVGSYLEISGASPSTAYGGGWTVLTRPSTTQITFNCGSSTAGAATGSISYVTYTATYKGSKQRFSDLPTTGMANGDVWQIVGEPTNSHDNYYVKWVASSSVWVECPAPNTLVGLNASTMPHKLVREADGTFTFGQLVWDKRLVGDDVTNPKPTFVGRTITDVLFYRNRLGFLSDETLIMSRPGKYFNFWAETVTAVLDSDPIDVTASNVKVSILNWAVTFNKALLLFSDQTQYQLSSGDVLTPKSVKLEAVTEFESSKLARPVTAGQNVFFALDKNTSSTVREYFVDSETFTNDAADITAHVPTYLPGNVVKMSASSSEDVLFALSADERNALYVYKYYWGSDEKLQSAWGKFVFAESDSILNIDLLNTTLYLTIQRADGVYLEKMELQPRLRDGDLDFLVHLDRKLSLQGVYDAGTNTTTWTLPHPETEALKVVLGDAFGSNSGGLVTSSQPTPTTVTAIGNYSAGIAYIGRSYVKRYRLSQQFLKDSSNITIIGGRLQLRKASVLFDNTGYFRAEVTALSREMNSYPFTGKVLGTLSALLGRHSISSGKLSFPVLSDSKNVQIDFVNDSHLPSFLQSVEWEATYSTKVQRVLG